MQFLDFIYESSITAEHFMHPPFTINSLKLLLELMYWKSYLMLLDIKSLSISVRFKTFWPSVLPFLIFEPDIWSNTWCWSIFNALLNIDDVCFDIRQIRQLQEFKCRSICIHSFVRNDIKVVCLEHRLINMRTIKGEQLQTRVWPCVKEGTFSRLTKENRKLR